MRPDEDWWDSYGLLWYCRGCINMTIVAWAAWAAEKAMTFKNMRLSVCKTLWFVMHSKQTRSIQERADFDGLFWWGKSKVWSIVKWVLNGRRRTEVAQNKQSCFYCAWNQLCPLQYYDQILGNARYRLDRPISCKMESKSSALANHAILFLVFLDTRVKQN